MCFIYLIPAPVRQPGPPPGARGRRGSGRRRARGREPTASPPTRTLCPPGPPLPSPPLPRCQPFFRGLLPLPPSPSPSREEGKGVPGRGRRSWRTRATGGPRSPPPPHPHPGTPGEGRGGNRGTTVEAVEGGRGAEESGMTEGRSSGDQSATAFWRRGVRGGWGGSPVHRGAGDPFPPPTGVMHRVRGMTVAQ